MSLASTVPAKLRLLPLALMVSTALAACHHHNGVDDGAGSGNAAVTEAVMHHEDGTTSAVDLTVATTSANQGATMPPTTNPVVPDKPIPVADATTLWLMSNRGGSNQLGEIYQVSVKSNVSTVVKSFTGRPWSGEDEVGAFGLVFNPADGRFYGVIDRVGLTYGMAVLYSFDPRTDSFKVLKTLSRAGVGSTEGLNGTVVEDLPRGGFLRKPLLSPDGKSMILLADAGGRDDRGMLIHVNLDPASPKYLSETVVYDFFSYEQGRNDYCQGLVGPSTELVWAQDGAGASVIYMGRQGEAYLPSVNAPKPTYPTTCPSQVVEGRTLHSKYGRVFMLRPSNASDLSQPWAFAGGDVSLSNSLFRPLDTRLPRQIFFDASQQKVRFATENVSDGMINLFSGDTTPGGLFEFSQTQGCYSLTGMLPLDSRGNGIVMCSGLNKPDTDLLGRPITGSSTGQPPKLFTHNGTNGQFVPEASLNDWYSERLLITGSTWGESSKRLYLTGGDDTLDGSIQAFGGPARIEEINPYTRFSRQLLVKGSVKTTGYEFFGDPAVGGSINEPLNDRYVVWLGTVVSNASMTLNKHDRLTGQTTTIKLETDAGAHPWGKLLDLGNGLAMGRMEHTPPSLGRSNPDGVGGYRGAPGWGNQGSRPGLFTLNLKTGQVASLAAQQGDNFSPELARTEDGQVWGIRYQKFTGQQGGEIEQLRRIDPATGASQIALSNPNKPTRDLLMRRHSPEARGNAVYGVWFDSLLMPPSGRLYMNEGLLCLRSDNPAVRSVSGLFGPNDQGGSTVSPVRVPVSGDAHAPVEGPTYSPTHDALYMATSRVGSSTGVTIFEIDKGVARADLCKQAPVITKLVSAGGADLPATKILATRSGVLVYGSVSGKLMKIDPLARSVTMLADLKASGVSRSEVKGFLTEIADGVIAAVVYDYDAAGRQLGRRLAGVSTGGTQIGSHDVSNLIGENEPYPGINRFN